MDVDTFIAAHSAEWQRLDELAGRRRLHGAEADELVALYRQVATHLALVQSRAPDPALTARLSRVLTRARAAAVGAPPVSGWSALARGITVDFPVAVYRTWRWSVAAAVGSLAVAAAMMLWLRAHPERVRRGAAVGLDPPARRSRLRRLLLRASGPVVRGAGVDEQRPRGRPGAVPRRHARRHALRPVAEHRQHRAGRRRHARRRQGHGAVRPAAAARDARAQRGLRRHRGRPAHRLGLGRPRAVAPRAVAGRGRPDVGRRRSGPGRGAARVRRARGVRDAVRPADVGAHRDRGAGRGGVRRVRRRARPPRPAGGRDGRSARRRARGRAAGRPERRYAVQRRPAAFRSR